MSELDNPSLKPVDIQSEEIPSEIAELNNKAENWPDSLLQKYGELQLPSLYDFILSQEKLGMEIRRQNKEMRGFSKSIDELKADSWNVRGSIADVCEKVSAIKESCDYMKENELNWDEFLQEDLFEEEEDEEEANDEDDSDDGIDQFRNFIEQIDEDSIQVLMHSMDTMLTLLNATEDFSNNILSIAPSSCSLLFWQKPAWRSHFEEVINGYNNGMRAARNKLLSLLVDKKIELINPSIGSSFDPQSYRAVEKISGGQSQCIAKVIRYGYRRQGEVLRFADVSVFL